MGSEASAGECADGMLHTKKELNLKARACRRQAFFSKYDKNSVFFSEPTSVSWETHQKSCNILVNRVFPEILKEAFLMKKKSIGSSGRWRAS